MGTPLWTITGALSVLMLAALSVMATALSRDRPDVAHPQDQKRAPRGPLVRVFRIFGLATAGMLVVTAVLALLANL